MMYVRAFLPWIVYAVVPSGSWQWGAVAALVVAVFLVAQQRRAGRPADAVIIEMGSAVFFAALAVLAFADPHSGLHPYSAGLANGMLALIAVISLAVRRPFTLGIAKQSTPREYWNQPAFLRINMIITSVWAASFAVAAIVIALIAHAGPGHMTPIVIVQVAGLVAPMVFTNRYVAHVTSMAQAS
jgi:anti-sigma-K factor RskA